MALHGILEAEGRTGALAGAGGRLSNLVLEMRRQDIEEARYQEGSELRGLQTETAGLNIQQLRNQINVQEAEEVRLNEPLPISAFEGAFEDPSLYAAAENIAKSMGFINYDDPNLPTITRRDMFSMNDILSQQKVRTDMAITGYNAFEKRYTDLTKAVSDYEAQNEGKGKDLNEDKNYQYLLQQKELAGSKAMQYKQLKNALLATKEEVPGKLEKDVTFLMEDLGMSKASALAMASKAKEGEDISESIYTEVIKAGGSIEEAATSADAARAYFGIKGKEQVKEEEGFIVIGGLKFTREDLKSFGVEGGVLKPPVKEVAKPKGQKVLPKLEKYQRSEATFRSELKKTTKQFNEAKKRFKNLKKAKAHKSVIAHAKKEMDKLSKMLIKLTNVERKLKAKK